MARNGVHIDKVMALANDRERLKKALFIIFENFGVPNDQQVKIIKDVRACDFTSLCKLLGQ